MSASIADAVSLWAERVTNPLPPAARPLKPNEQTLAEAAGVTQVNDVRIVIVDQIPFPDDPMLATLCERYGFLGETTLGLTLGHVIFLTPQVAGNAEILAHECCHVAQVERFGSIRAFVRQYIGELIQYGYAFAPLELEATQTGQRLAGTSDAPWE